MCVRSVHEEQAAARPSTGSSTDPMLRVLDALKRSEQRMEHRLDLLEAEMHRSQDEAVQKAAKKAKREKSYSFRKKGHQEQHDFNERVSECFEEAAEEIAKRPATESALDKAKQAVEEGMRLIGERQK